MTLSTRAERLQGTTERRSIGLTDFELRESGNSLKFEGYASLFDTPYDMYGGPDAPGGWTEYVDAKAFDRTLALQPDVVLNLNHGESGTGLPIARTSSGTLELRTDGKGLRPRADLDLRDPDVQALRVKVERGDVNQMSFAFRTLRQKWANEETERRLLEVSLDRGDVSIVTNGAQPKTSLQLRSLVRQLAMIDPDQAKQELRALDAVELPMVQAAAMLLDNLLDLNGSDIPDADDDVAGRSADTDNEARADYSAADRQQMAKDGEAMPDGSYPIKNEQDLHDAIHAVGRGGASHDAIRRHIITRAHALGLTSEIPSDWNSDGSMRSLIVPTLSLAQAKRLALLDI
jgi:HK97 family phage prohead protease